LFRRGKLIINIPSPRLCLGLWMAHLDLLSQLDELSVATLTVTILEDPEAMLAVPVANRSAYVRLQIGTNTHTHTYTHTHTHTHLPPKFEY